LYKGGKLYWKCIKECRIESQGDIMATKLKRLEMKHKKNKMRRRMTRQKPGKSFVTHV